MLMAKVYSICGDIRISVPYSEELIDAMRVVPGKRWDNELRQWIVSRFRWKMVADIFDKLGISYNDPGEDYIPDFEPPKLYIKPYPYQLIGMSYLINKRRAILGDVMGLGKTIEALGAAKTLVDSSTVSGVLIIVPASLQNQWHDEALKVMGINVPIAANRKQRAGLYWQFSNGELPYLIMTYEKVKQDDFPIDAMTPDTVTILDEATKVKNMDSAVNRSIRFTRNSSGFRSKYMWALTGTPLQNSPDELYAIDAVIGLHSYGSRNHFIARYVNNPTAFVNSREYMHLDELRQIASTTMLRRTRADVGMQLPGIVSEDVPVTLSASERLMYDAIQNQFDTISEKAGMNYFLSLSTIFREFCDSPRLMLTSNSEIVRQIMRTRPKIDFSVYGSKLDMFMEYFPDMSDNGEPVIIFTQFAKMADLLHSVVKDSSVYYGTSSNNVIDDFKNGRFRVLITTTKGGMGLNLTNASTVIHYDKPWNPATMDQMTARVFRPGQKRVVSVFTFTIHEEELIEKHVDDVLGNKRKLFDDLIGGSMN